MPFGQLVIGPPGSGKTTYCNGMHQYLTALGRKVAIINLDPANDVLPYTAAVDVSELVCLETVMEELKLGPNGGEQRVVWVYVALGADKCIRRQIILGLGPSGNFQPRPRIDGVHHTFHGGFGAPASC